MLANPKRGPSTRSFGRRLPHSRAAGSPNHYPDHQAEYGTVGTQLPAITDQFHCPRLFPTDRTINPDPLVRSRPFSLAPSPINHLLAF